MRRILTLGRSFLAALAFHVLAVGLGFPIFYLVLWPLAVLFPSTRTHTAPPVSRLFCRTALFFIRLGGGRVDIRGRIPAEQPCYILMNHQSVLDIPVAILAARPRLPAFVTRRRYARGIPVVSPSLRIVRWPVIEPEGDPAEAFKTMAGAVRLHPALLLFPESHRTRDGEIGPFFPAGLWFLLKTERRPVYLIVIDGFRACSHWRNLFTSVSGISAEADVLGPWIPPVQDRWPEFIEGLRQAMIVRLDEMRKARGSGR